jgi:WS/DGAT/MGAT family acyltransferase
LSYTRLNGAEALFLRMDRGSGYQHTLKIAIVDPSTDPDGWSFDCYRTLAEHQLRRVRMMRQRYLGTPLGLHQPTWVDDPEFDLDTQLRRVACPAPGGMAELCALIEQVYCQPLDHSRPLWQVWVVEGLQGGRVGLLALIHHAYADGAGMRAILEQMTSAEPTEISIPDRSAWTSPPLPAARRRLVWAIRDLPPLLGSLAAGVQALRERVRREREFGARGAAGRPSAADRRKPQPFGGVLPRGRRFACESFSLADMKEVRATLGGMINDVFLACVSGSLRRYLAARGITCDTPMVAGMPFTTKPPAERPHPGGVFSSADDVWLHPEIDDPVQRLAACRASAQVTKDHFEAVADADPFKLLDLVPGGLVKALARLDVRTEGRVMPVSNVVVSNVRGFDEPRYLGRWRMERWFSTGQLWHGATLNFTGWSYGGLFEVCVLAGSDRVPDAWPLIDGFRASLDELLSHARSATSESAVTQSAVNNPNTRTQSL